MARLRFAQIKQRVWSILCQAEAFFLILYRAPYTDPNWSHDHVTNMKPFRWAAVLVLCRRWAAIAAQAHAGRGPARARNCLFSRIRASALRIAWTSELAGREAQTTEFGKSAGST
jgi:hypothetical protein